MRYLKSLFFCVAAGITVLVFTLVFQCVARAADADQNCLTPAEKKAGWKLLFDGKTTKGWHNYQKKTVGDNWKVVDGALTRVAGGGDIVTDEEFDYFELSLDYKIAKAGNSGIMFHVAETEKYPFFTGPEVQILDNPNYPHESQKAGWLYALYKADTDATKPAGEWNHVRIIVRPKPEKSEVYLNGVKYCEFVIGSKDWDKRVANSKFHKWHKFGKLSKGHIDLQDHGAVVAFRNIKIRPLPVK
ncbi:MAG: 3-keto-disaccharide hydrolase [Thermoguttaceae bacterium]